MALTHGSLFTGIGGFDLGFERAGMESLWQVERDPFCLAILETHWPNVGRFTDVREVGKHNLAAVDVISGGFPCQDVSIAGKRGGLSASRTGLFFDAARILKELQPAWFILENVPGMFSSNKGKDFRIVIETLADLGYGVAWRILDSQYFGVAQRRRRLYIVGSLGKPCPTEILFESPSGTGNTPKGRKAGEGVASEIIESLKSSCGKHGFSVKGDGDETQLIAHPITKTCFKHHDPDTFVIGTFKGRRGGGYIPNAEECADGHIVFHRDRPENVGQRRDSPLNSLGPGNSDAQPIRNSYPPNSTSPFAANGVRGFTGLPEGLDSARYRSLGNAVTASVTEWIGRRITSAVKKATFYV